MHSSVKTGLEVIREMKSLDYICDFHENTTAEQFWKRYDAQQAARLQKPAPKSKTPPDAPTKAATPPPEQQPEQAAPSPLEVEDALGEKGDGEEDVEGGLGSPLE